jgi:hypothetical protein
LTNEEEIMRAIACWTILLSCAALAACAPYAVKPAHAAVEGCQYDTQCKADRICSDHRCITPPVAAQPTPQQPAAQGPAVSLPGTPSSISEELDAEDSEAGGAAGPVGVLLDLDDTPVDGGELGNLTAGVNWYLNPAIRLSANYIHTDREDLGEIDFFGLRTQVAF